MTRIDSTRDERGGPTGSKGPLRRRAISLVCLLTTLAVNAAGPSARARPEAVTLAGTLRIRSDGIEGLVLDVPRKVDVGDVRLVPAEETAFVYFAMAPSRRIIRSDMSSHAIR